MQIEELVEAAARRMAVVDGQNPDKLSHNSFEWWRHYVPMARAALQTALSAAEPETNNAGSECEPLEKGCTFDPNDDPKTENIEAAPPAPSVAVKATPEALEQFTAYFVKNYPGPDTIIFDPKWHAPKIFRAVVSALSAQVQDVAGVEAIDALKEAEPYVEICHSLMTQKETRANVWRVLKRVRSAIAAAPAKQEGMAEEAAEEEQRGLF